MKKELIINKNKYIEDILNTKKLPEGSDIYSLIPSFIAYYYKKKIDEDTLVNNVCSAIKEFDLDIMEYQEYVAKKKIRKIYLKILKNKRRPRLRNVDTIDIYESEIENVSKCETDKEKKLLFTLYVLAKYENKGGWIQFSTSDIFKYANVAASSIDKEKMIGKLAAEGKIELPKAIDKLGIKIDAKGIRKFPKKKDDEENEKNKNDDSWEDDVEEEIIEDEDIVLSLTNLKNIGNQYYVYANDSYIMCESCGKIVKKKAENQKYCFKCAPDMKYDAIGTKIIKCIDCGKDVEVDAKDNATERCEVCYEKYRRSYYRIKKREQRLKSKMSTEQMES